MAEIPGKQGKDLLSAILMELKDLDPRIVPLDSDEIQAFESGVVQGVRDVFGSGSPEYAEFEGFRVAAGNISRGDSRAEKQAKYELGLPKAVKRLEELLNLIDQSEKNLKDLPPEELVKVESGSKTPPAKPSPPKTAAPSKSSEPEQTRTAKPTPAKEKSTISRTGAGTKSSPDKSSAARATQPGRILLLQEGADEITSAVKVLLDKVGIDLAQIDDDSSSGLEGIIGLKDIAFTIMVVSAGSRGGLSGLTSVIGKPQTRHENVFKLGLLVGNLGPGKVLILYGNERPQDIPDDLFGIRYIPFKEEGGWQIGLLKLLKANGFTIDANLLFD